MLTLTCDGCGRRITESDAGAARRVPIPSPRPAGDDGLTDWCGACVQIIRTEVPRLARQAREARRAAAPWPIHGFLPPASGS